MAHPNLAHVLGKGKLRGSSFPGDRNSPMVKWGWWGLLGEGGTGCHHAPGNPTTPCFAMCLRTALAWGFIGPDKLGHR